MNLNASSKYIRVGCEECPSDCKIISGSYELKGEETNSIKIPSGYELYDGNNKISGTIYNDEDTELLFGCDKSDSKKTSNVTINSSDEIKNLKLAGNLTCEEIIGPAGISVVKLFIVAIRIFTPIIMIVLSSYDFMECIPNKDEDAMFKAWKRLETRAIITVLIMLLPTFLNVISRLFEIFDSCSIW